jgi:hypothetical protein
LLFFASQIQNKERTILEDNDAVVLMCLLFIAAILTFQISKEYLSSPFASQVSAFSKLRWRYYLLARLGYAFVHSIK